MANNDWDNTIDEFDYGAINYDTIDEKIEQVLRNSSKTPKLVWSDGTSISRPPSASDEELIIQLSTLSVHPRAPSAAESIEFESAGGSDFTNIIVYNLQRRRPVLIKNAPLSPLAWESKSCFQQLGIHPEVLVPVSSKWGIFLEVALGKYLDDTEIQRGSTRRLAVPRWTMPEFMGFLDEGYLLGWAQPLHLDPRPAEVDSEHCWVQFLPKYNLSSTIYHPYGYATQFQVRKGLLVVVIVAHNLISGLTSRDELIKTFTQLSNFCAGDLKDSDGHYSRSYSIILNEGDILVLPPATFYQTYASEDTILTGNCFLHLKMLHLTEALRSFAKTCPATHVFTEAVVTRDIPWFTMMRLISFVAITSDNQVLPRKCIAALTSMVVHGLSYTLSDFDHPISASLKAMGAKLRDPIQTSKPPSKKGLKVFLKTNVGDKPLPVALAQSQNGEKLATFVSHRLRERLDIQVNIVYKAGKYSGTRDYLFEGGKIWTDSGYPVDLSSIIAFRELVENKIISEL